MIQIRKANAGDTYSVKKIEDDCFSQPWSLNSLQTFTHGSDTHFCFVAVDTDLDLSLGDSIVGYIAGISSSQEGEIANIAVHSSYRNRGVGNMLMRYFFEELKKQGVRRVFLEVRKSNKNAIGLYQKNGFQSCGERKNYYCDPIEDALIMCRDMDLKSNEIDKKFANEAQNSC